MKKIHAIMILGVLTLGFLFYRESVLQREVEQLRLRLEDRLTMSFASVETYQKIKDLTSFQNLYTEYLEPVILASQNLMWPAHRQMAVMEWKQRLNERVQQLVNDKTAKFKINIQQELDSVRLLTKAGTERVVALSKTLQNLPDADDRIKFLDEEVKLMEEEIQKSDRLQMDLLKQTGKEKLNLLRKRLKGMSEEEVGKLVLSGEIFDDVQMPIAELVMDIRQDDLRSATYREFGKSFRRALKGKEAILARQKHDDENPIAEALLHAYDREVQKSKSAASYDPLPKGPSDASSVNRNEGLSDVLTDEQLLNPSKSDHFNP